MYKVFIYDNPIFFIQKANCVLKDDGLHVMGYKSFQDRDWILESLQKNSRSLIILAQKNEFEKEPFFNGFSVVEAAGGIVVNRKGEILFIFRNGKWDLPKGKIELGEKKKVAAIREVEEECGISDVYIKKKLITTYHTYELGGKKILKPTYWYEMQYEKDEVLIPQLEEGITEVKWVRIDEMHQQISNTFGAIKDVIQVYLNDRCTLG